MAKSRQQLLASMVMLGINRIVITDGSINAKVIFDMRAEDKAKREYTASMSDRQSQRAKREHETPAIGGWFSPVNGSRSCRSGDRAMSRRSASAVDETSEARRR